MRHLPLVAVGAIALAFTTPVLAQGQQGICSKAVKQPNGEWKITGDTSVLVGGAHVDLKPQSIYRGEIKINGEDLHDEFRKSCMPKG